jgi:predicted transcriptional regulator
MVKKHGPRRVEGDRKTVIVRLKPELADKLQAMADSAGLSRNQLIEHILTTGCAFEEAAEATGASEAFEGMLRDVMESALRKAMRSGGIDLALHKAEQAKRAAKKAKKKVLPRNLWE